MSKRSIILVLGAFCLSIAATRPALPQEPAPPPTLWSFLGISQGMKKARSQLFNRNGNLPGLEQKPPLLNIADPANLESEVPAIKAAAEIKQAEDLKDQKIKAIKYLADIGCGCYDKDEKITKALVAAMEDCTEKVRLEAVKAVAEAASGECCQYCSQKSCCNEKVVTQLSQVAYETDEDGCYIEPSERVRAAAAEALQTCCWGTGAPVVEPEPYIEGMEDPPAIESASDEPAVDAPTPPAIDEALLMPPRAPTVSPTTQLVSSRRRYRQSAEEEASPAPQVTQAAAVVTAPRVMAPVREKIKGEVVRVDRQAGLVRLHLYGRQTLTPGTSVKVYHRFLTGTAETARLEIVDSQPGVASARPLPTEGLPRVARGDEIEVWR